MGKRPPIISAGVFLILTEPKYVSALCYRTATILPMPNGSWFKVTYPLAGLGEASDETMLPPSLPDNRSTSTAPRAMLNQQGT
ncbi:MAG: hypothetical protein HYX66_09240 [Ignavibacteria bacterium]|nr:hypothetical protein [Ignavibacteria bacterium]